MKQFNIKFPKMNAENLIRMCQHLRTKSEVLENVELGALVIGWDNCEKEDTPFYRVGFINSVQYFNARKPIYEIITLDGYNVYTDNIKQVPKGLCPLVTYRVTEILTKYKVGHIFGLSKNPNTDELQFNIVEKENLHNCCVDFDIVKPEDIAFITPDKYGIEPQQQGE